MKFPTKTFLVGTVSAAVLLTLYFAVSIFAPKTSNVAINGVAYQVEVADTPPKRAKGLMNHGNLGEDKGMLFVFEESDNYAFWNQDTFVPLDLIYIDEGKIVEIGGLPAYNIGGGAVIFTAKSNAEYVLEVNAGQAKKHDFREGDEVKIQF